MVGNRRFSTGKMNSSSQKMCPRYASPCRPRAGTPMSRSSLLQETVCSKWSRCSRRMRNSSAWSSNSIDSRSQRWAQASVWASRNLGESALPAESSLGACRRLGRRDVAAGDQCDDLLHRQRLTCRQVGEDLVADLELLVDKSIRRRRGRAVAPYRGPRGEGYRDLRLRRLNRQQHRVRRQRTLGQRRQVGAGQLSVTLHQAVADVAIERRADLDRSRPVLGGDRRLQRGDVRHVHRDESMLGHRRGATGVVAETQLAGQDRAANVENLAVGTAIRRRRRRTSRRRRCGMSAEASWEDSPDFRDRSWCRLSRRRDGCTHRRHRCPGNGPGRPCDSGAAPRVAK